MSKPFNNYKNFYFNNKNGQSFNILLVFEK